MKGRCETCGKTRANITVNVRDGEIRELCPACLPPLRPSATEGRKMDPTHRDPLIVRRP